MVNNRLAMSGCPCMIFASAKSLRFKAFGLGPTLALLSSMAQK